MTSVRRFATAAGVVVLVGALVPPLHSLADQRFSAHMVQHLLIMLVAPGLFAWGSQRVAAPILSAAMITAVNVVVLWVWHLPRFYDAALGSAPLHVLEHLTFFIAGLLFWRLVLGRTGAEHPVRVGVVFVTMLQSGALGALITFANGVLYQAHLHPTGGLTPLEDQQLAGVIMWVPAGVVYLVVLLGLLSQMLRRYPDAAGVVDQR